MRSGYGKCFDASKTSLDPRLVSSRRELLVVFEKAGEVLNIHYYIDNFHNLMNDVHLWAASTSRIIMRLPGPHTAYNVVVRLLLQYVCRPWMSQATTTGQN